MLLTGAAMLAGVLGGAQDPLQPLGFLHGKVATNSTVPKSGFERIHSVAELDQRIAAAATRNQPVMLDFYADWCDSCKEMEKLTFADTRVRAKLAHVLLLQADVTANSDEDAALLRRFDLFGPPGIVFFGPDVKEKTARIIGYEAPEEFLPVLNQALGFAH
jgi:thiol:disulfide interchange protein DsbD